MTTRLVQKLPIGVEPTTLSLQVKCAANCATEAYSHTSIEGSFIFCDIDIILVTGYNYFIVRLMSV